MKKSSQISIEQFAEEELKRLEAQRQEAIKAKGGLPYLGSLPVGESLIRLLREIPKDDVDQNDNPRKQFTARKNVGSMTAPKEKEPLENLAWTVNPRSPLYRDLIQALPKAPVWLRVIRTGESKSDTRWTVKVFEPPAA